MANRLYVSFWDLCLTNLPQGRFEDFLTTFDDEETAIPTGIAEIIASAG